jgi:MFS family permease
MLAQYACGGAILPFISLVFLDRGLNYHQSGLLFTAASATMVVFPLVWGMLADRYVPLNRIFLLLNFAAALALTGLSLAGDFTHLLLWYTVLAAVLNPNFMLVGALCFHHLPNPREQFGRLRAWGSIGWILPFLPISLWLLWRPGARLDFILPLGIVACLSMVVVSFFLPHTPPGSWHEPDEERMFYGAALRVLLGNANYVTILVSYLLVAGSYSLLMYYSPPYLEQHGLPRVWLGPVQAVGVLFEVLLLRWHPRWLRRWNFGLMLTLGCAALLARQLIFYFTGNLWVLCLSYLLAAVPVVFHYITSSVLVNALAAREVRATAQTLLVLAGAGIGPMLANAVAGLLAGHGRHDLQPVFLFAAAVALAATLLVAWRGRAINAAGHAAEARPAAD